MTGRFLFVHLQKTAGTALLKRLRHHFGPAAVYPTPSEQGTPEAVLDIDRMLERAGASPQIEVVTGHFPLAAAGLLGDDVATFTVLRNPVDRVLSFLRHQREVEARFAATPLEAIYDDPVTSTGLVHDHMVKMLSLTSTEMTAGALSPVTVDEGHLERATDNLASRVDVVGLQAHFDVFCADLERVFDWDLGPPVRMNRTAPVPASKALCRQIERDNSFDVALYEHACRLWEQTHPGMLG